MKKVVACLSVALALGLVLVIDVFSTAPPWTVYMEWTGLILAFIAAVLYFLHDQKKRRKNGNNSNDGNGHIAA